MVEELPNGLMLHLFHYLFLFICFPMFCLIATGLLCNSMLPVVSFCVCMFCKYVYE